MLETITQVFYQVTAFVTSAEFQAFMTATIGVVTTFALMQNKLSQLKVANAQVQLASSNNKIADLEHTVRQVLEDNATLHEENRLLRVRQEATLDIITNMALGSRLSDKTRSYVQERYLKVAKETAPKVVKDKRGRVVENVKDAVEQGLELVSQVAKETIVQVAPTLSERMKQLEV